MASVKVLINSETNIILFKRMNQTIIDGYKRKGIIPTMREHKATFEATHGVGIAYNADSGFWKYMEFPSEQDYTMAVLKWL
jgi:hypothetical protein